MDSLPQPAPRSAFFDPFLTIRSGSELDALAQRLATQAAEAAAPASGKAERVDAQRRRLQVTRAIVANVIKLLSSGNYRPGDVLALSTAKTKATRYDRKDIGKHLWAEQAHRLADGGWLIVHPYVFRERLTTLEPSRALIAEVAVLTPSLADLEAVQGQELVWLSARVAQEGLLGEPAPKELVDYADDEDSQLFRYQMERINSALNAADITFDGAPVGPVTLRRTFLLRRPQDEVAFSLNGRLAGGFWMQLPATDRHRIRINGEQLADLDYKAMFVQLAYRHRDWQLSETFDPYVIPGLEGHRDAAKLAMLSLLGRQGKMRRLSPELKQALPEGWDAARLNKAVKELHPDLVPLLGEDKAVDLMFDESQILVAVLLRLIELGVPALPMHDGIMVQRSHRQPARDVMRTVSHDYLGEQPLPVTEKPIPGVGQQEGLGRPS